MYSTPLPTVAQGRITFYQLYDLGEEISLAWIAEQVTQPMAFRQMSTQVRQAESIQIAQQPLQFFLKNHAIALFGLSLQGTVKASLHALGAVALSWEFSLPSAISWETIVGLMGVLQSSSGTVQDIFAETISSLEKLIYPAIIKPHRARCVEDYSVLVIECFSEKVEIASLSQHPQLRAALLGEKQPLSDYAATMLTPISYYVDDLALLSWNGAILIEPDGLAAETALELIEFANVELLLMRSYDEALDAEISRLYGQLPKERPRLSLPLVRRYSSLLHDVQRLIVELTQITERVDNVLKVTDDVYWNRFYSEMLTVLKVEIWRLGVEQKLALLRQTYSMLHDEADTERATALEWTIVFLILFEIIMALVKHG